MTYPPKEVLRDLIDANSPWETVKRILSGIKDQDRFDKYLEIRQERVGWKEKIILPYQEHLYIVEKGKDRVVKCDCGHEFGDYRENWKLKALIDVLEGEELETFYPSYSRPDRDFCEVRRFYCPGCGTLLEVETVPRGYPIIFDFLPDIDRFYADWLKRPLSHEGEFVDLTHELTRKWAEGTA